MLGSCLPIYSGHHLLVRLSLRLYRLRARDGRTRPEWARELQVVVIREACAQTLRRDTKAETGHLLEVVGDVASIRRRQKLWAQNTLAHRRLNSDVASGQAEERLGSGRKYSMKEAQNDAREFVPVGFDIIVRHFISLRRQRAG